MRIRLRIAWGERSDRLLMVTAGWSAAGHFIAIIVFSLIPRFTTPPPMPHATIAEIIPASALLPPAPPGGDPEPRRAEPTPSERAEAAREAARDPEPPPPEPKKPVERAKPQKKKPDPTVPPPPDEKPKEPPAPEPEPDPGQGHGPETPSTATTGPGITLGGAVGPGGIPSIGSSAFPYDYYRSSLVAILQSNWRRPVAPDGLAEPVSCRVQFTILKSGIIQDARISAPSGNDALDQSALRAVFDSNPLPPLPFQYGQGSVGAEVVFELTSD